MDELLRAREQWLIKAEKVYSDVWLTGKEVTKRYPCISQNWLRRNGQYLRRARGVIRKDDGTDECTIWGYSLNYIEKCREKGYIDCNDMRYYFNEDCTELKRRYLW